MMFMLSRHEDQYYWLSDGLRGDAEGSANVLPAGRAVR